MFKYSSKNFNKLLTQLGCVRVGTLYDFRRLEHQRGIADPFEGLKTVSHHIESLHIKNSEDPAMKNSLDFRSLSAFQAVSIKNCRDIRFENCSFSNEQISPNCFLYCLSTELSEGKFKEFEGADTVVELTSPVEFFKEITASLNKFCAVRFLGVHKVSYQTRTEKWNGMNWGENPALIKDPQFAQQIEIRALWEPVHSTQIEPVVFVNAKIPSYCKFLERHEIP